MRKTKLFSYVLLAAAWLMGGSAQAWDEPAQDANGVYQIGTASELEWFAEFVNSVTSGSTQEDKDARLAAQAVLTADIDLIGISHSPIGRYTNANGAVIDTYKFAGKFDGQFHTISNLVIDRPEDEALGLFGFVRGNAKIKNIIMDSTCSVRGYNRVGSIVGLIQTTVSDDDGGPLEILNCVSYATLTTTSGAAGMIGAGCDQYPRFDMENCVNAGKVSAPNKGSAFCGWNRSAGGNSKMWNCLNIAEISVLDGGSQLFRGANRSIANCYDTFHSASNFQGEHPTYTTDDPLHSGEICYLLNTALRSDLAPSANPNAHPFTQDLSDPNSIPLPVPGKTVYQVADYYCDGTAKGTITYSNTDGGSVDDHVYDTETGLCTRCSYPKEDWMSASEDGYYHLSTVAQVEWFSYMVSKAYHGAMNAKLDNDIDFGGVPNAHKPIGTSGHKFGGKFDGQGFRIKGMVITPDIILENRPYDGVGFFGSVRGGIADNNWSVTNTDVVIENLIIDSSCSINFDNRWAAGILGHINSLEPNGTITVRNCGNEANISATDNASAGIVGIVEATAVKLDVIGCWNTGNITGTGANIAGIFGGNSSSKGIVTIKNCWNEGNIVGSKENGAISGWVGSNAGNDVTGCYNLGQVTNLEGTKTLYRGTVTTGKNNCDVQIGAQEGNAQLITVEMVPTGELCYLLNGDQTDIQWTQTLDGTQPKPLPDATGSQVYCHGQVYCSGVSAPGTIYDNNGPDGVVNLPHNFNEEMGMCDVCYTQFQEPALVDDVYELKNAGNVEWYSAYVSAAGGNHKGAKLMNDIDFYNIENLHSPIGLTEQNKFNSTFDGQGYRIKNMIIERPADSNLGFFGWLRGNANNTTIKNLIIDSSCSIHGYNRVGGVTGTYQNGGMTITIEKVVNEATVTAEHQDAGGIFGGHQAGNPTIIIRDVLNTGTITAKNGNPYAGALCCYLGVDAATSVIENFLNLGVVNGHMGGNMGRYNITNVTNLIDLSDTDPAGSTAAPNAGYDSGLEKTDLPTGKVAYTLGWGQLIGADEIPYPLNETKVSYVGDAGYATLYDTTTGYELNGDVTANVAIFDGQYLQLSGIENVPVGTPVILKGTYYNKLAQDLPAINVANDLQGTAEATEADGTMYILALVDGKVGFYKATGTIAAGKAYFQSTSGVKAFFLDGEDDPTGIETLSNSPLKGENIYNLAGQRLQKMQKGINVINGKKVLVK